jgi:hypothetical protein
MVSPREKVLPGSVAPSTGTGSPLTVQRKMYSISPPSGSVARGIAVMSVPALTCPVGCIATVTMVGGRLPTRATAVAGSLSPLASRATTVTSMVDSRPTPSTWSEACPSADSTGRPATRQW